MQRIRIKGVAAFQSTPPEYMRDMLRYDDGKIEAIWDYPTGKRFESVKFTAIVQLHGYTPDRWRSFGLYPDVLGDVGTESPQGYTVDERIADRSPVQEPEAMADYQIVTRNREPLETFKAGSDKAANTYAEEQYPDLEWYVLNEAGYNINAHFIKHHSIYR